MTRGDKSETRAKRLSIQMLTVWHWGSGWNVCWSGSNTGVDCKVGVGDARLVEKRGCAILVKNVTFMRMRMWDPHREHLQNVSHKGQFNMSLAGCTVTCL